MAMPPEFDETDPSEALLTEPATHTVLSQLREKVVTGLIPPGARLRAEALASELKVSRTPVRSALAVLSAEGLVSYGVNRGYTVRAVTIGDIFDAIETRAALESLACRLSVERGWSPEDLLRLGRNVAGSRAIIERNDWSEGIEHEWYRLNWLFHRFIVHAARNLVLRNAVRMTLVYPLFGDVARICPSVAAHVPARHRALPSTVPDHIRLSQSDHEAVLAAITAGDGPQAERLMAAHVLSTRARVHAIATLR